MPDERHRGQRSERKINERSVMREHLEGCQTFEELYPHGGSKKRQAARAFMLMLSKLICRDSFRLFELCFYLAATGSVKIGIHNLFQKCRLRKRSSFIKKICGEKFKSKSTRSSPCSEKYVMHLKFTFCDNF